jgi:hypothetical protein
MTIMTASAALYIVLGVLTALSLMIILCRIAVRRFLGYPALLDASAVLLLAFLLHGTILGMLVAIIAALAFSCMIWGLSFLVGYERLQRRCGRLQWVSCRPPLGGMGSVARFYLRGIV